MVIQKAVRSFVKYNNMRYTVESQWDELNNSSGAEKGNDVEEHVDSLALFFKAKNLFRVFRENKLVPDYALC